MATNRERLLAAASPRPAPEPSPKPNTSPKPDPNYVPPNPLNAIPGYESLSSITGTVADLGKWIGNPRNWVRILEVFGGSVLCIVALFIMAKSGAGPVADGMNTVATAPVKVVKTVGSVIR